MGIGAQLGPLTARLRKVRVHSVVAGRGTFLAQRGSGRKTTVADDLHERISAAFRRAREKLAVANRVLEAGFAADAVPPAYYACYFAAEAALASEGDEVRTHEGLKSLFGLRFIRPGLLPARLGSILRELKDERQSSDYSVFPAITETDAAESLKRAHEFVAALADFLETRGFATKE
jgi:uncharacterized protein (UPF0332 family)